MILYFFLNGIFLTILLLYFNSKKYPSAIYLGNYFLLISIYGINHYILWFSESVYLISIMFINSGFLYYLIGPMLYLYVRSVLTDDHRLKKWDVIHLLPALFWIITTLPYMLTPYDYKMMVASECIKNQPNMEIFKIIFLYNTLTTKTIFLSRPILVMIYTFWSIGLYIKFMKVKGHSPVLLRQCFMTQWLYVLFGFTLILATSHLLLMIKTIVMFDLKVYFSLNVIQFISLTGLEGLLVSLFFFPEILYGLPRLPKEIMLEKPEIDKAKSLSKKEKINTPNFENDYFFHVGQKADTIMKDSKPFLQPDFNLIRFAVLNNIPVHHMSCYFRAIKKQRFTEYMNNWRIEYAKRLIRNGETSKLTLEAIGQLSGFSSRNAFLNAFKKKEGISPKNFKTLIQKKINL
jgi:AraC-like DNA-binding protein